jgi:hypothetical protein
MSNTTPRRRSRSFVAAMGAVSESRPEMRSESTSTGGPSVMRNARFTLPSGSAVTAVSTTVL